MKVKFPLLLTIVFGLSLCACQKNEENNQPTEEKKEAPVIDFHTELQFNYLNDFFEDVSMYADGTKELSKPKGYEVSFENPNNILYTVNLTSDIDNRSYNTRGTTFTFNNLYLNTEYHYSIQQKNNVISEGDFVTNTLAPRNIDIDGITNFRDLGGHLTNDNKYSKQGMIYRSAKFNGDGSKTALITTKGKNVVINELGIKSEIDLRLASNNETGKITSSVIDSSVNYFSVPMTYDGDVFELNKDEVKHLFDIISIRNNFPFVFHCSIGTDRTGFVAMILNALLDVKQDEIYRDYLFSNFGLIGGSRNQSAITNYLARFTLYGGLTLKEQVNNYLLNIGVEQVKIDSFISIMSA